MVDVFLSYREEVSKYPDSKEFFNPDEAYPEYIWGSNEIAKRPNPVYKMVREALYGMELDKENFGTKEWNPLSKIINEGDCVLIKPNWVENENKNKNVQDNLDCLVTNPSVIRPIIDYVLKAIGKKGRLIIGDAPMQGCNLNELLKIAKYDYLFKFYKDKDVDICVEDLRKYSRKMVKKGVFSIPKNTENSSGCISVTLDNLSMHAEKNSMHPKYKVSDYSLEETAYYHSNGKHGYEINKIALLADVIINVPKPKTHRLAGMTAAMKNFVGITYDKTCLPHRIEGAQEDGGDAYLARSKCKEMMYWFDEKRTKFSKNGHYVLAKTNDIFMKISYALGSFFSKDKYRIGSWYGNDTIWRTIADLNYILLYADKTGKIQKNKQRKILVLGDMIICGQKDGPIAPIPKPLGMIMIAQNCLSFDRVMCEIMGFDFQKFPLLINEKCLNMFGYNKKKLNELTIMSNIFNKKMKMSEEIFQKKWEFVPHTCWKNKIEKVRREN